MSFWSGTRIQAFAVSRNDEATKKPSLPAFLGVRSYQVRPPSMVRRMAVSLMPQPFFSSIMAIFVSPGEVTTGAFTGTGVSVGAGPVGPGVTGLGISSGVQLARIN